MDCHVLDLLFVLFGQQLKSSTYNSVLISALAVCGLKADGSYLLPNNYTHFYAALVKIVRWLILGVSYLEDQGGHPDGLIVLVEKRMDKYMLCDKRKKSYPINSIYKSLAYGKAIARQTGFQNQVFWDSTNSVITCQDISFSMDSLRQLVQTTVREAGALLLELLMVDDTFVLPLIPWETVADNHSCNDLDYSFLTHVGNALAGSTSGLCHGPIAGRQQRSSFHNNDRCSITTVVVP